MAEEAQIRQLRDKMALEQVNLTAAIHLPVGRYSHGMQSRLSVARPGQTQVPQAPLAGEGASTSWSGALWLWTQR